MFPLRTETAGRDAHPPQADAAISPVKRSPLKKFTFSHEERIPSRIKILLDNDKSFEPAESYEILEPGGSEWVYKKVADLAPEIENWPKQGKHTRILIVPGHDQRESTFPITETQPTSCFPITMPKDIFEPLLLRAGIPLIYAAILFQHNARYLTFSNGKRAGFIIHMRNPGFSYAVTYPQVQDDEVVKSPTSPTSPTSPVAEEEDDTTYAIVMGLRERDIQMLVEEISDSSPASWIPAMIATCLLEMMGVWTNKDSSRIYGKLRICETELQTKTTSLLKRPEREKYWFRDINFDPLTRDLTIIATSLARVCHQTEVGNNMLKLVESVNQKKHVGFDIDALAARMADLHSWYEVLGSEAKFYVSRTEANRQTVFNFIQQQDNLINVGIAQTSLLESNAMKILAKATAKDSSQMLFFSIITFVLLPATFTGTFFSSTFFSFQDTGWTVAPQLYIYFAVTIPLALFIGLGWWLFRKIHGNEMERKLQLIELEERLGETVP